MIYETDEQHIDEYVSKAGKTLVEFFSPFCGPCKMLSYVLDSVDKETEDLSIVKINFLENPDAVSRYDVKGYPTLIYYTDGKEVRRHNGIVSKKDILQKILA